MPRPKKFEVDPEMFEGMAEPELKDAIIRNIRQIKSNLAGLKDYRNSVNELNAELDARIDAALEALGQLQGESGEPKPLEISPEEDGA